MDEMAMKHRRRFDERQCSVVGVTTGWDGGGGDPWAEIEVHRLRTGETDRLWVDQTDVVGLIMDLSRWYRDGGGNLKAVHRYMRQERRKEEKRAAKRGGEGG